MKIKFFLFLSLFLGFVMFSCKKQNPEDPWFSHGGKHLNDRLDGEWELVSLHISKQDATINSKDVIYEDYSNLLDIDTMNIAKFFKFVPTYENGKEKGGGDLYIKTKNMESYPEKLGISQSMIRDLNDTNVSLTQLTYQFLEGSTDKDYFKFDVKSLEIVDVLSTDVPVFKPFDDYFLFNNFYIRTFYNYHIMKATNKELILFYGIQLESNVNDPLYRRYRLTFKKIN